MLFLREAMSYHGVLRLVLLTLCSILVPAVLAGKELSLHLKTKSWEMLYYTSPLSSPFPENILQSLLN